MESDEEGGEWGVILEGKVREGFLDEVIFDERFEYIEGLSFVDMWGKYFW